MHYCLYFWPATLCVSGRHWRELDSLLTTWCPVTGTVPCSAASGSIHFKPCLSPTALIFSGQVQVWPLLSLRIDRFGTVGGWSVTPGLLPRGGQQSCNCMEVTVNDVNITQRSLFPIQLLLSRGPQVLATLPVAPDPGECDGWGSSEQK